MLRRHGGIKRHDCNTVKAERFSLATAAVLMTTDCVLIRVNKPANPRPPGQRATAVVSPRLLTYPGWDELPPARSQLTGRSLNLERVPTTTTTGAGAATASEN